MEAWKTKQNCPPLLTRYISNMFTTFSLSTSLSTVIMFTDSYYLTIQCGSFQPFSAHLHMFAHLHTNTDLIFDTWYFRHIILTCFFHLRKLDFLINSFRYF